VILKLKSTTLSAFTVVSWQIKSNFLRILFGYELAFVVIRLSLFEVLSSLAIKRLCLLISFWNVFFEIQASLLYKRAFCITWWNMTLLASKSKSQVSQMRVWWTPCFETWNAGFVYEVHVWLRIFKSTLLWPLDMNVASSTLRHECGKLCVLNLLQAIFKTCIRIFDIYLASHVSDASLISDCIWIHTFYLCVHEIHICSSWLQPRVCIPGFLFSVLQNFNS